MVGVIARPAPAPGPYLIVGLARSGVAAALAMRERGEQVAGTDSGRVPAEAAERLQAADVAVHAGVDGVALLEGVRTVVKSPGVPRQAPVIAAALERGIEVIGEVEL